MLHGRICKLLFQYAILSLREKCPNTEFFFVPIQSEYSKIRARNNCVFGHFSCSVYPHYPPPSSFFTTIISLHVDCSVRVNLNNIATLALNKWTVLINDFDFIGHWFIIAIKTVAMWKSSLNVWWLSLKFNCL